MVQHSPSHRRTDITQQFSILSIFSSEFWFPKHFFWLLLLLLQIPLTLRRDFIFRKTLGYSLICIVKFTKLYNVNFIAVSLWQCYFIGSLLLKSKTGIIPYNLNGILVTWDTLISVIWLGRFFFPIRSVYRNCVSDFFSENIGSRTTLYFVKYFFSSCHIFFLGFCLQKGTENF